MNSSADTTMQDIAAKLRLRVIERTNGRVRDVRVDCTDGRLIIRGRSPSYFLKQLTLEAIRDIVHAERVPFVLDVQVA